MKYVVMECHVSYAVVLDEEGRFLNVANRHYEVGQTVTDVVVMQEPQSLPEEAPKRNYKWLGPIAAIAACLVLMVTTAFQLGSPSYASVYMTINPEVRIDVNQKDVVVDVEGINEDGKLLIENYNHKKKNLDFVMDELVDRAIEMGFLHKGGQITLTLDADDQEWVAAKSDTLDTHLHAYLADKLIVTIEITNKASGNAIPHDTGKESPESDYGESDYGELLPVPPADVGKPGTEKETDYDDSDFNPHNDGMTDYDDSDYGPIQKDDTDYDDETDYDNGIDEGTNYEDDADTDDGTDYEDDVDSDSASDYEDDEEIDEDDGTDYGDTAEDADSDYDGDDDDTDGVEDSSDYDTDEDDDTDYDEDDDDTDYEEEE